MATAYDQGFDLFKREPELLLVEVFWRSPKWSSYEQRQDFVDGYMAARRHHDGYVSERKAPNA